MEVAISYTVNRNMRNVYIMFYVLAAGADLAIGFLEGRLNLMDLAISCFGAFLSVYVA